MIRIILFFFIAFSSYAGSDGVDDVVKKNISKINNFAADSILDFINAILALSLLV